MRKLSTGQDSTLENWIMLSAKIFGDHSRPTQFLKNKALDSPKGYKEEVWADEAQLMMVLLQMNAEEVAEKRGKKPDEERSEVSKEINEGDGSVR